MAPGVNNMDSLHNMPARAPTKTVSIGVVGLGRMGKRHAKTLLYRTPTAKLVAVCTISEVELAWAREFFAPGSGVTVYDSYDKMLQHQGLEAVWVSTSTDLHAPQANAAIAKGLHVLCEKPLSTSLEDAQSVVDAAEANPHLKVMAGYSRRFDASYREAKAKIEAGAIGTPFMVRSQTGDLRDDTGFFVRYAAKNGAVFVDCSIHDIDLTMWFLGDDLVPKTVFAIGTLTHHPELAQSRDVDNGIGVVEFWGGKMAYYYCSRTQAHGQDVATEIIGTHGKIMVNLIPRINHIQVASATGINHEVPPEYWERFEDAFATEANEFCDSILENKPVPVPMNLGVKGMKIAWALQHALWHNKSLHFDRNGNQIDGPAEN
ncbi:scyllo-inositol 2-dehydrogenase (NAD(+)) [Lasiodiplodia hormozganensis]|uniref:Scyllo-inositol 2-dehydrogenase (NAD(+)) n=1 Tax=Lasiodiplodia hormozganensis TaxID=869390 RepID=A0AA39Z3L1_9PEZI|nr:scyllo-inositol 2-dehydrogenase (NAD(+)) [Lasiodiplodia hormozganensis]